MLKAIWRAKGEKMKVVINGDKGMYIGEATAIFINYELSRVILNEGHGEPITIKFKDLEVKTIVVNDAVIYKRNTN